MCSAGLDRPRGAIYPAGDGEVAGQWDCPGRGSAAQGNFIVKGLHAVQHLRTPVSQSAWHSVEMTVRPRSSGYLVNIAVHSCDTAQAAAPALSRIWAANQI